MAYIGQQDISVHAIDKANPHEVTKTQVGLPNVEDILNNEATTNPLVTSDVNAGYVIKSRWINTTADTEFVCTDSTIGAAVWVETTASGGTPTWGGITGTIANQTDLQNALNAKEDSFVKSTAFNKDFGTALNTLIHGNDSRLSDARVPTVHVHTKADISDFSDGDYATSAQGILADSALQNITAETLVELSDIPTIVGQAGKLLKVNATADGYVWGDPSGTTVSWGDIAGTLSAQTDLQTALNLKSDTSHTHTESDITDLQAYLLNISGSPLSELSDVTVTTNTAGEVLKWTGTAWINSTIAELSISTTDIAEGTNLYYTEARVTANTNVAANTTHGTLITNPHSVTATQVGLGSVDNTTDLNKPISTATQTALDLKSATGHAHTKSDISDFPIVDADVAANAAISAEKLKVATLNGAIYNTVQDLQDIFHSAGYVSGGVLTDNANGTVAVALGSGIIRAVNTSVDTLYFFDWIANASVTLTDNSLNWIYVDYNAGNPIITVSITKPTETQTKVILAVVYRSGTNLHISETEKHTVGDHAGLMIGRNKDTMPFANASGARMVESGTRNISISAGKFWEGLQSITTSAADTSGVDTFNTIYRDGIGGFTEVAAQSTIDNLLYDDGTGTLATLANNAYAAHWIYQSVTSELYVVYGQASYTLTGAQDSMVPATLPPFFERHCILMGRVIIQKSATNFTSIESAFMATLSGSVVTDHGDLVGLADDDHTQYALSDGSRGTFATTAQGALADSATQPADLINYQSFQTDTVSTTDATPTVIGTVTVALDTSVVFTVMGTGRNTVNGDVYSVRFDGSIKNISGTTSMVGSINTIEFNNTGAAAWVIQATANDTSDNLEISVTGGVGLNIDWKTITTSIGV